MDVLRENQISDVHSKFWCKNRTSKKIQCIPLKLYKDVFVFLDQCFFIYFSYNFHSSILKRSIRKTRKIRVLHILQKSRYHFYFILDTVYFIHFSTLIEITHNILIIFFQIFRQPNFLEFIYGGMQINFTVTVLISIFTCQGLIDLICIATQKNSYDLTYRLIQKPDLFTTCITC